MAANPAAVDRTGTHHYTSEWTARLAYGQDYAQALAEGRVAVGEPVLHPGQWVQADIGGRYFICSHPAPRKET